MMMSNLIQTYLEKVPDERKMAFEKLFNAIHDNLPTGFELTEAYGMLTWVVPLSSYPAGYHCARVHHFLFSAWPVRKIFWHFIIWVYMPIKTC